MKTTLDLIVDVDTFTLLDLLRKAATHKGLKLHEGASKAYSEPIKVYVLDEKLLAVLAERNIKLQSHFTRKYDVFELTLYVGFNINTEKRGVVLIPRVVGTTGPFVPEKGRFPFLEFFKAMVDLDTDLPAVTKELATSDGTIVVTWAELGLGGIRKLSHLFSEFAARNETVARLGRNGEVFNPAPNLRYQQLGDELFVAEPAQPKVIQAWRDQLNEYRAHLVA